MIGQVVNRYRIESKIGEGGMGVVYKAHDTSLDRHVAIKVLPQDRVSDPARKQRFVLEARAASALNHPGIVTVHDIASDDGVDFIVMELVSGRTLDEVIHGRGMSVARAMRYGAAIADAIAKAHEAGIVHRDLKPSNVMVTDDDRVKVLDFGLAKLVEPAGDHGDGKTRTGPLTEAGIMLGTAAYMSPEQVEAGKIDARSDIFSLGAVLYEMVTGRRPFSADSQVGMLSKIVHDDPPAPSQFASMPPEVERAILRCLRKDPARRFQTAADLKVALDDLADDSASGALAPPASVRAPRRRVWMWAALVPGLLAAASAGWWLWPAPGEQTPLQAVPLASLPGVTRSPSFSPDGNQVAYSWNGQDGTNVDVYVQQIGSGAPLRLTTNPASDGSPLWSPDGRWIAFLRQADGGRQELRLVPPLGGPERRLAELHPRDVLRPLTVTWCPSSDCVVVTDAVAEGRPDALFVVSLETGAKRQLTRPPDGNLTDNDPAISPDGKWLAFRRDAAPFAGEIMLQRLASDLATAGEPRAVTPTAFFAYNPRWTPDSAEIVFSARGGLWRLGVDAEGRPQRLPFVGEDGLMPIVSRPQPDRGPRLVYVRSYIDANIWRIDVPSPGAAASTPPVPAITSTRRDATPGVAPDGRHVAFTSTRSGDNEVWRAEASGAAAVQLTSMGGNPGWPRWSPDGQHIAFHAIGVGGSGDIFVMPAEGGTARNLTSHPATDVFASFSRDGQSIYFSSTRLGESSIWKAPVSGGPAVQMTTGLGVMAVETPDGASLYYTEGRGAASSAVLWRIPVAGGAAPVRIADGVVAGAFDVVPGGVYYLERLPGDSRLQFFDAGSQTVITVARNLGNVEFFGLGVSGDGRAIFFTRIDASVNDLMLVEGFR